MKKFAILLCMTSSILCMGRLKREEKKAKRGSIELNAVIGSQLTLLNTYERDRKTEFDQLAHNQQLGNIQLEKTSKQLEVLNRQMKILNKQIKYGNISLQQIATSLTLFVQAQTNIQIIESDSTSQDTELSSSSESSPELIKKLPVTIITGISQEKSNRPPTPKKKQKSTVKKSAQRQSSDVIQRGVKDLKKIVKDNSD